MIFPDMVCGLLSEWCVVTLFCQRPQTVSSYLFNLRNLLYLTWRDSKPLATIQLTTPDEYAAYTAKFWPWRGSELVDLVHSCPNSRYYIDAWDYYHNGIFQYTRYCVLSL